MEFSNYMSVFLDEAREAVDRLNELLLGLEAHPEDPELIHEIFRTIHSFKGMASTMGFDSLAELAHAIESLLAALRDGSIRLQAGLVDALLHSLDGLSQLVAVAEGAATEEPDVRVLKAELAAWQANARAAGISDADARTPASPVPAGERKLYEVAIRLDSACLMKSVRALMITSALEAFGEVRSITPSLEELEWIDAEDWFYLRLASAASDSALIEEVRQLGEVVETTVNVLAETADAPEAPPPPRWVITIALTPNCMMKGVRAAMVLSSLGELGTVEAVEPPEARLMAEDFESRFSVTLVAGTDEATIQQHLLGLSEIQEVVVAPAEAAPTALSRRVPLALGLEDERPAAAPAPAPRRATTVRVEASALDALAAIVGQLLGEHDRLSTWADRAGAAELSDIAGRLGAAVQRLRGEVTQLRLVPAESLFNRFPRMARELARELGKDARLVIEGSEVGIDRRLAEGLGEVLMHMVRNGLDHGLETPAERLAAGKPAQGTLRLAVAPANGEVVFSIADDGRGLDGERLREIAIAKGLIGPHEAAALAPAALRELIFLPGFSTAAAATTISGRGVGMDVVRHKVESLGGTIELSSERGAGTTFTLRFPIGLAVVPAMLADVGGEVYGIPAEAVEAVVELADRAPEALTLEGERVPIVALAERLALAAAPAGAVVVVRTPRARLGLLVGRCLGEEELAVKPLSRLLGDPPGVAGAATLGDGRIALMLDPERL